ncbi:hypothetical protein K7432_010551 [Basidiobolus ranarum]|uniref:Very-long-chain (3R)-3-hydroxyacyl-CoA dehydratase n=1 Tax=Basidiobolus ranarum TaxID=34480 RepID=A0ABR2WNL1_9FUNG
MGIVRSPVLTTIIQVFSRVMLVWGILFMFSITEIRERWAFTSMTVAWCVTESIRYLYYALNLLKIHSSQILWARYVCLTGKTRSLYTFFYALYPLGATSEAILIYKSLDAAKVYGVYYYYYLVFLLFMYPPVFLHMYTHMIIQRKRYLTPKGRKTE